MNAIQGRETPNRGRGSGGIRKRKWRNEEEGRNRDNERRPR